MEKNIINELITKIKERKDKIRWTDGECDYDKYIKALENLLTRNKELEADNKKYPIRLSDEGYRKVIQEAQDDVMGNIKELRKRNSEMITKINQLEQENEAFYNGKMFTDDQVKVIKEKTIPKSKVKEKIEEIKLSLKDDCLALHEFQRIAKIDVLEELLES